MTLKRSEISIKDPFILTDEKEGCYYTYGATDLERAFFKEF